MISQPKPRAHRSATTQMKDDDMIDHLLSGFAKCILLGQLLFLACLPAGHAQSVISPTSKNVQIDVRGVSDSERASLSGVYAISPSSELNLPRIGKVRVHGWGYSALSLALRKAYRDSGLFPNIEVSAWLSDGCSLGASPCIDISGELWVKQLSIPLRVGKTILSDALKVVRPKDSADMTRIEILRNGQSMIIDATQSGGLDTELKTHDLIRVPARK